MSASAPSPGPTSPKSCAARPGPGPPRCAGAADPPPGRHTSGEWRDQDETVVAGVVEGLKQGENHILWPAGHVHRTDGATHIGSARGAADVLQGAPKASVLLVRTLGLWGSSFSYAPTGTKPNMFRRMLAGAGWILANLLLFMPRRTVD